MKIMAISAHPDDIEINCAGTLAKYAKRGDHVIMCNTCNGNQGHFIIRPDELAAMRLEESRRSAALIGAEHICLGYGDAALYHQSKEARDRLTDILRAEKPDMIITHTPDDYMPDHVATAHLVFDASFAASLPHYSTSDKGEGYAALCPIFYMDNLGGFKFEPTEYVDIGETFEIKMKMLACHESQMKWMKEHDGIDFGDTVKTFAKMRGLQAGVNYAEGFKQLFAWDRVRTYRMLP